MAYWLMKSEPFKYSWDDLVAEGEGTWDGVRNYLARNNLMAMQVGDEAFFYHSREGLEIVGIAEITVGGIGDPTDETGKWVNWTPFSYPFNLTQQPAASVPCGFTKSGLPAGLHVVGRMFDDQTVLRASHAYETATDWHKRQPKGF